MPKFRKKPVIIEAEQWDGTFKDLERIEKIFPEMRSGQKSFNKINDTVDIWTIQTLEGNYEVLSNDFIIKGIEREFYPCKPNIFEQTYEFVGD